MSYLYQNIIELSQLSNQEYVKLIGHYNQIGEKTLESQLINRSYSKEKIEQMKSKLKSQPIQTVQSLNVRFKTNSSINFDNFGYYYNLYSAYTNHGVLPYEGALTEQPNKIIEIFNVFDQLSIESEKKQMKELDRKQRGRR